MASLQDLIKKAKDTASGAWNATKPYNVFANIPQIAGGAIDTMQKAVGNQRTIVPDRFIPKSGGAVYNAFQGLTDVQNNIARPFLQGAATPMVGVQSLFKPQAATQFKQNQQLVDQEATKYKIPQQVPLLGGRSVPQLVGETVGDPLNYLPGLGKVKQGGNVIANLGRKYAPNVAINAVQGGLLTPAETAGERAGNAAVGGALGLAIPVAGATAKAGVKATKQTISNLTTDQYRAARNEVIKKASTNPNFRAFQTIFKAFDDIPELRTIVESEPMMSDIRSGNNVADFVRQSLPQVHAKTPIKTELEARNVMRYILDVNDGKTPREVPPQLKAFDKSLRKAGSKFVGQAGSIKLGGFDESNVPVKPNIVTNQTIDEAKRAIDATKAGQEFDKQLLSMVDGNEKKLIASVQNFIEKSDGDMVTFQNKYPEKYRQLLSTMTKAFGEISETDAWDMVKTFPRSKDLRIDPELKAQVKAPLDVYNAEPGQQAKLKIAGTQEKAAKAEFDQWQKALFKQERTRTTTGAVNDLTKAIKTNTVGAPAKNVESLKDLSGFMGQARDVYRNFKAVYGSRFDEVKKAILDPFDASKGKFIDDQKELLNELDTKVVKGLGIKKGSKESAAVMEFGEGKRDVNSLIAEFGQEKAKKIIEADKFFRQKYDSLLDQVNAVRAKIYPNNPEKIIPKRSDYYRHFREMQEGFAGLANIFETPSGISSKLSGVSPDTKPKSKWLSFAQKRTGDKSDVDAVGGFLDYTKAWSYAVNIDPHISKFRALADDLATQTAEGPNAGKLNNFIEYLQDYANDLSGKTHPADRFVQKVIPGGRTTMRALTWVNNRVKANTIVGNVGSMVAQVFNVPQGVASAGVDNTLKGMGRTMAGIFADNSPLDQSNFIKERYASTMYDKFDTGLLANSKNFAGWITGVWDEMATKMIWNAHYEKALKEGIQNPVKYSDDLTRSLVAGRGIGEQPLIQSSKLFQLAAPFQLEVGNLWHVLGEMKDKKEFGKIATLFVTMYGMNKIAESIRGSDVGFDPIDALIDGYNTIAEEDDKTVGAIKATGRVAGELISNVPLGQTVGSLYPEYGFKINEAQMPTRKDFFGDADPTRFGGGLLAQQALQDPLYKLLPAYGGGQLKKTIEGLQSYGQGYSETESGKVRFPVDQTPSNAIKSTLFGQYGTSNARDFFNSKGKPLGDKQSEEFKSGGGRDYYNEVMEDRAIKREDDKLNADPERSFIQKLFAMPDVEDADAATSGGRMVKDVFRYRDANKTTQKFNTAPLPQGTTLADLQARKDRASDARSLIKNSQLFNSSSKITEEEAMGLIEKTGLDPQKIKFGAIDDLDTEGKAQYVNSVLTGEKFSEDEFNNLVDYGVLDTSLIKEMAKQKMVDEKEAEALTDLVKAREIKNGDRKAPKGRKLNIKGSGFKFSIPQGSAKIAQSSKSQLGNIGSVKLNLPTQQPKRRKITARKPNIKPIRAQGIRISG